MTVAATLVTASAGIILFLGVVHLVYTFVGSKLHPRDAALAERMKVVSPVITSQTSMWHAWVGFNASHSIGAILFGTVFAYLAASHSVMLFQSGFLLSIGLITLLSYLFLGARYWFSIPFRGVAISTTLYVSALAVANFAVI